MAAVAVAGEASDARKLPPGFRFHPSDEEIVGHYLKNKVSGKRPDIEVIREIDLYKCEPWDLPDKSILPTTRDQEWFFFSARDKKYPNGSRSNRATEKGYWKATGKDRKVTSQSDKIGMKKTLVFYRGRAPNGQRTDWLMHEYRLDETQCIGAPHLKELYVVCRVFRKPKQGLKNGEQYGTIEDFGFSLSKSNLSRTNVNIVGEIEESEERSSPLTQEDDTQATSGLRSETSSEIIDNKIEDNAGFDGSMDSLQGRSNPDCSHLTVVNKNAHMEQGTQELPSEPASQEYDYEDLSHLFHSFNSDHYASFGDAMDAYCGDGISPAPAFFEDNFDYSVLEGIIGGGNFADFGHSDEEPNNYQSFSGDVNGSTPGNGVQFELRTRSLPWQEQEEPWPSQGTAKRRLRMQIYKTDESEDQNKLNGLSEHCQSECHDCSNDDSEIEGSAPASLPRKINSFEEDDADSSFVYDSSEAFKRVANGHSLMVEPTQALASCLSTEESSERSENSLTATGSEEESILSVALDALRISGCDQSSCASDGLLIQTIQDNSKGSQEQVNKPVGNGVSISVSREEMVIDKSEDVEKCEDTISECNSEVPNQASEFGDSLVKGVKLVSLGTSSTELQTDSEISSTSAQEVKLVKESMKYSASEVEPAAKMGLKKGNLESDGVGSFTSMKARAISSHSTGIQEIGICCEGSVKHGLKLRGKPGTKDMVFDGKEKSMDLTRGFSHHSSKEGDNGSVNLQKAHGIFKWFSKLKSNLSKGSSSISVLMCLLGTAILVFFIRVIWQLARSSPPIIFLERS